MHFGVLREQIKNRRANLSGVENHDQVGYIYFGGGRD